MLHTIRTRPDLPSATNEPTELLLACHGRLRHFSELSRALATRDDVEDERLVDAAHRLLRYFRVALPLHEDDEERSLAPVLLARATEEQADAMDRMRDQHGLLHDVLADLFPLWERVEAEPRSLDRKTARPHALRLATVLDVHLELEETLIFPMVAAFPSAERRRLAEEMRARRSPETLDEMRRIAT